MKKSAGLLIAFGLSTVAWAQPGSPQPPAQQPRQEVPEQHHGAHTLSFEMVDKNKDGQLNKAEASTVPGLDFTAADINKNSALDRQEYTAAIAKAQPLPRG